MLQKKTCHQLMSWCEAQRRHRTSWKKYVKALCVTWQVKRIDDDDINYFTEMFSIEMTISINGHTA